MTNKTDEKLIGLIPPSLDLSVYESSSQMNSFQWFGNLAMRYLTYSAEVDPKVFKSLAIALNSFALYWACNLYIEEKNSFEEGELIRKKINSICLSSGSNLPEKSRHKNLFITHEPISDLLDEDIAQAYTRIAVDLDASDEILIEKFSDWLRKQRDSASQYIVDKKVSQAKFRRWYDARVLQYLDVSAWHSLRGTQLTNGQMSLAIFPDDKTGGAHERIRKTTVPLVKRLMSKQFLVSFSHQVQNDWRKENI